MSNKLPKPNKKTQRTCVFCGGLPLTREHMFPDWIKSVLYKDPDIIKHTDNKIDVESDENLFVLKFNVKLKTGHLISKKLLIVCQTCNNGWMSLIQSTTKSLITALILKEKVILNQGELAQLVKWIVMTTMVAEFDDVLHKQIPLMQLKVFKDTMTVPDGWKIWIGKYEGNSFRYHHQGGEIGNSFIERSSMQFSIFIIGGLLLYILSTDYSLIYNRWGNLSLDKLTLIYPFKKKSIFYRNKPIDWHLLPLITDNDVNILTSYFNVNSFISSF